LYFYGNNWIENMEQRFTPQNLFYDIKGKFNVFSVENDFLLIENDLQLLPLFDFPFKVNTAICVICTSGSAKGKINLHPFEIQSPSISVSLPNQILQYDYISEDFNGSAIVFSPQFFDRFFPDIQQRVEMVLHATEYACIAINNDELQLLLSYCNSAKTIVGMHNNPFRLEMLKHLFLVLFYTHYGTYLYEKRAIKQQTTLVNMFLELVKNNFKKERQILFYAERLCLTPKYLSLKIRDLTGKSANEWIDDYVMLEAKALLKSTNMTIQQISDELNFSSQSFFGKYFKRCAKLSPKEYREK